MSVAKNFVKKDVALVRRYLIWCFKTTKESLDRIDRKFTQVKVDLYILNKIKEIRVKTLLNPEYQKLVEDFQIYVDGKKKDGIKQKFIDTKGKELNSQYYYLKNRLIGVEHAIKHFLGPRELASINRMYEQEMTRRILESKDH